MRKLKLQSFGHLTRRVDSLEKTLMLGGIGGRRIRAYGGNGAGAAVGIGRDRVSPQTGLLLHPHINGGSDQETSWDIVQDEN